MNIPELLRNQAIASTKVLEALLADVETAEAYQVTYHYLGQISRCASAICNQREHKLILLALKEYQFAQFALAVGMYRQAFASLRLVLELALSAIDFSVNEIKLRRWFGGDTDIVWSALIDKENGVLSPNFVQTFCIQLKDHSASHLAMAEKAYRECSEYVHGNASTHKTLPSEIQYSRNSVHAWCDKAATVAQVVIFAFAVRYMDDLDKEQLEDLKPVLLETLGHIEDFRGCLGGAVGG
jgi:hypothetical protein